METRKVASNSQMGKSYDVSVEEGHAVHCNCPAGEIGKVCVHMRKVNANIAHGSQLTLNANLIKIMGGKDSVVYSEYPLNMGEDLILLVKGSVAKVEEEDLHDGTFNRIFKVKPSVIERVKTQ